MQYDEGHSRYAYSSAAWSHDHSFGQAQKKPGEVRTLIVIVLTTGTMIVEIAAGMIFGSMALLADGLHMASHACALAIAMFAYVYARWHAHDERFSFGTGKVNSLAGFSGAILLAVFALMMAWESVERLFAPVPIAFNQALLVAVAGLLVNGLSVFVLGYEDHDRPHHGQQHASQTGTAAEDQGPANEHEHEHEDEHEHEHEYEYEYEYEDERHHDHNLRSAYLHVLADALTSLLAIFALLAGKYAGLNWLDPVMGVVGAILVARWSAGLLKTTSHVLLDRQGPQPVQDAIRKSVERNGDEVADLHLWATGPGTYSLILSVLTDDPRPPDRYRDRLPRAARRMHVTIEVWHRGASGSSARSAGE